MVAKSIATHLLFIHKPTDYSMYITTAFDPVILLSMNVHPCYKQSL